MKKILFLCTGNTCRSPMAEALFNALAMGKTAIAESAGLEAADGKPVTENTVWAVGELGFAPTFPLSRYFDRKTAQDYDLIFTMTQSQKDQLPFSNVYTLNEYTGVGEIVDPFLYGKEVYLYTAKRILKACKRILERLSLEESQV